VVVFCPFVDVSVARCNERERYRYLGSCRSGARRGPLDNYTANRELLSGLLHAYLVLLPISELYIIDLMMLFFVPIYVVASKFSTLSHILSIIHMNT